MNRKTIFFSPTCTAAMLFLPSVLLHATAIRAPDPAPALQGAAAPVTGQDIRDIIGPILLPEPPPYVLYGGGLLLLMVLVLAIWWCWRLIKKRKRNQKTDPAILALSSLQEAEDGLPQFGILLFAGKVSNILRSYIEAQFQIPTSSCTTSEFFYRLETSFESQRRLLGQDNDSLRHCLLLCDKIKFSRFLPEREAVSSLTQSVRSFIETTRAQPAEER